MTVQEWIGNILERQIELDKGSEKETARRRREAVLMRRDGAESEREEEEKEEDSRITAEQARVEINKNVYNSGVRLFSVRTDFGYDFLKYFESDPYGFINEPALARRHAEMDIEQEKQNVEQVEIRKQEEGKVEDLERESHEEDNQNNKSGSLLDSLFETMARYVTKTFDRGSSSSAIYEESVARKDRKTPRGGDGDVGDEMAMMRETELDNDSASVTPPANDDVAKNASARRSGQVAEADEDEEDVELSTAEEEALEEWQRQQEALTRDRRYFVEKIFDPRGPSLDWGGLDPESVNDMQNDVREDYRRRRDEQMEDELQKLREYLEMTRQRSELEEMEQVKERTRRRSKRLSKTSDDVDSVRSSVLERSKNVIENLANVVSGLFPGTNDNRKRDADKGGESSELGGRIRREGEGTTQGASSGTASTTTSGTVTAGSSTPSSSETRPSFILNKADEEDEFYWGFDEKGNRIKLSIADLPVMRMPTMKPGGVYIDTNTYYFDRISGLRGTRSPFRDEEKAIPWPLYTVRVMLMDVSDSPTLAMTKMELRDFWDEFKNSDTGFSRFMKPGYLITGSYADPTLVISNIGAAANDPELEQNRYWAKGTNTFTPSPGSVAKEDEYEEQLAESSGSASPASVEDRFKMAHPGGQPGRSSVGMKPNSENEGDSEDEEIYDTIAGMPYANANGPGFGREHSKWSDLERLTGETYYPYTTDVYRNIFLGVLVGTEEGMCWSFPVSRRLLDSKQTEKNFFIYRELIDMSEDLGEDERAAKHWFSLVVDRRPALDTGKPRMFVTRRFVDGNTCDGDEYPVMLEIRSLGALNYISVLEGRDRGGNNYYSHYIVYAEAEFGTMPDIAPQQYVVGDKVVTKIVTTETVETTTETAVDVDV
eukprot:Nk52_evm35s1485 gene=Nk52_evmTU35s1485